MVKMKLLFIGAILCFTAFLLCSCISEISDETTDSDNANEETMSEIEVEPTDVIDVDYIDMWNNYSDNIYKDKYVKIIGKVSSVTSFSIIIKDGLSGLTGMIQIKPKDESDLNTYSAGDIITIIGRVSSKLLGALSMDNATFSMSSDDEIAMLDTYEQLRKAQTEKEIKEYKESAIAVSYENLIREPKKYEGNILAVTIKISQVMAGSIITESGYRGYESGYDNEWYVNYEISEDVPRIIENDTVTFYGEFKGLSEMKRVLGNTDYIPKLNAIYHVIN